MQGLDEVAAALVAPGKGILAADESIATMSRRLEAAGVVPGADSRRDYRALLLTTPGVLALRMSQHDPEHGFHLIRRRG